MEAQTEQRRKQKIEPCWVRVELGEEIGTDTHKVLWDGNKAGQAESRRRKCRRPCKAIQEEGKVTQDLTTSQDMRDRRKECKRA